MPISSFHKAKDESSPSANVPSSNPSGAGFELEFQELPGYLYVRLKCDESTSGAVQEYSSAIIERCREVSPRRMLLDRDVAVKLPLTDVYNATKRFHEMTAGVKLAVVNRSDHGFGAISFALMAYESFGGHAKLFETVEEAERWLMQD